MNLLIQMLVDQREQVGPLLVDRGDFVSTDALSSVIPLLRLIGEIDGPEVGERVEPLWTSRANVYLPVLSLEDWEHAWAQAREGSEASRAPQWVTFVAFREHGVGLMIPEDAAPTPSLSLFARSAKSSRSTAVTFVARGGRLGGFERLQSALVVAPVSCLSHAASTLPVYVHENGRAVRL